MKRILLGLAALLMAVSAGAQESSPDWVKIPHKWSMADMQPAPNPLTQWSRPPRLADAGDIGHERTVAQPWLPVPWLITSDDVRAAVKLGATRKPLSEYVQQCYRNVARNAPAGSIDYAHEVAFCAEVDVVGLILNQDAYFEGAENRIGTELITFAGLNTYQAVQTIHWMKATMTPMVHGAAASASRK